MLPGIDTSMLQSDLVSGFSVNAPVSANRTQGATSGPVTLTTPNVTAVASGAVGVPTFAWSRISGDSAITATAPGSATTAFTASVALDETKSAVFRVIATDPATGATATDDVLVNLHLVGTA